MKMSISGQEVAGNQTIRISVVAMFKFGTVGHGTQGLESGIVKVMPAGFSSHRT
jgi:hypothetical protein